MSFSAGSRVRLLTAHAGIPAGSLGTVQSGTPVTSMVLFDINPSHFVICPNSILAPAAAAASPQHVFALAPAEAQNAPAADASKLFWHTPRIRQPHVGTAATFVATTATPNTLSLLLEGAQVAVHGHTLSGTWIGSVEFPITGKAGKLTGQIRGTVNQEGDTISNVILCVGGLTTTIAFDGKVSDDFTKELTIDMVNGSAVQAITLLLMCQREPGAADCFLAVDSVDLVRA